MHDWVVSLKPFNALLFFAPLVTRSFTLRVSRDIRELWVAFPDTNNSSIPCRSVLDYPWCAASGQSAETRMDASTLINQLPQPVTVVQCCLVVASLIDERRDCHYSTLLQYPEGKNGEYYSSKPCKIYYCSNVHHVYLDLVIKFYSSCNCNLCVCYHYKGYIW